MEKWMFRPVDTKIKFPELEKEILKWWADNGIPEKYMSRNKMSSKRYSFIDGPITANNPMGVHHAWGRTYKDLFSRFRTMQGYQQRYQNGFDGQGLWIEVEVEKELGFSSKTDIEKYGVDKFVTLCKERVDRFADIISNQSVRLAHWMHWDDSYHTKSDENNYTIWRFLQVCYKRGWIYEGTDVMPWCPRCGTGLSQHEIVTEGYKEIVHPGLYVRFPLLDRDEESLLVWTTTPWTLPANMAVAVGPECVYGLYRFTEQPQATTRYALIAESLVTSVLQHGRVRQFECLGRCRGQELADCGAAYDHPFIDRAGVVRYRLRGLTSQEQLRPLLQGLLAEAPSNS